MQVIFWVEATTTPVASISACPVFASRTDGVVPTTKFEPARSVTDTDVSAVPLSGVMLITVGAALYVYWTFCVLVPPGVVTVTMTVPEPGGEVTMILASSVTVRGLVLDTEPNQTAVAPVNPVPVILTVVPPPAGPPVGDTLVTVGAAIYVNGTYAVLVPPGVVTVTPAGPATPAGEVTVIWVSEFTVRLVPGLAPNLTAVAPVNPVPVTVTTVPPDVVPLVGEMKLTVGVA